MSSETESDKPKGGVFFGRLAMQIYVAGVVQIVLVAATFALIHNSVLNAPWSASGNGKHPSAYILTELAQHLDSPQNFKDAIARADRILGCPLALYSADGKLLGHSGSTIPPFPTADIQRHLVDGDGHYRAANMTSYVRVIGPHGERLFGVVTFPPPPWRFPPNILMTGLALASLVLTSWVLARTLAKPLQRLAALARAFGQGDLTVRARLSRRDELGEVAGAFDEMAGRIAELVRAQKELLANISHELRTPLSRIRVALDIASEGNEREAREMLGGIVEDLAELEQLVDDVLTTARLDLAGGRAGEAKLPLRPQSVPLAELLDKSCTRFRTTHPGHQLKDERLTDLPRIQADAQLLRRAIDNLLDNAGKYSRPGTSVVLRSRWADDRLELEISDQGQGISASDLPQLFTPFFRADRSRTRATGGVGLGLTLAQRILDAHGGTLRVNSEVGKGTQVFIEMPARRAEAIPKVEGAPVLPYDDKQTSSAA